MIAGDQRLKRRAGQLRRRRIADALRGEDGGLPVDVRDRHIAARAGGDTLVLSTGTGRAEDPLPDCTRFAGPGTTTAIYMGARQVDRICAALRARGLPETSPVEVCVDVSKPTQRLLSTTLSGLAARLTSDEVRGCAILLVTWPMDAVADGAGPIAAAVRMERLRLA